MQVTDEGFVAILTLSFVKI